MIKNIFLRLNIIVYLFSKLKNLNVSIIGFKKPFRRFFFFLRNFDYIFYNQKLTYINIIKVNLFKYKKIYFYNRNKVFPNQTKKNYIYFKKIKVCYSYFCLKIYPKSEINRFFVKKTEIWKNYIIFIEQTRFNLPNKVTQFIPLQKKYSVTFYSTKSINFTKFNFSKNSELFFRPLKTNTNYDFNKHLISEKKSKNIRINLILKYIVNFQDKNIINNFKNKKISNVFIFNKYLINYFNVLDRTSVCNELSALTPFYNNYYPIIFENEKFYDVFYNRFKINYNSNYLHFTNKLVISFFEKFLKKKIYIKINSNRFVQLNNYYFNIIQNEYKNFNPLYFKSFLFLDFLKILWYSFMLKDLTMISNWISVFMETLNFKNHKKFVNFFQNFLTKYAGMFIDVLGVKGFFFDIRGKVGVTGSSKKRHLSIKFGSLKKSSKEFKINFNQNLVRTYSGVLGLTYIICF